MFSLYSNHPIDWQVNQSTGFDMMETLFLATENFRKMMKNAEMY